MTRQHRSDWILGVAIGCTAATILTIVPTATIGGGWFIVFIVLAVITIAASILAVSVDR
jgi:4-hydroxybenzoate polyprenyltransferase